MKTVLSKRSSRAPHPRPHLLTREEVPALSGEQLASLYETYLNPGLVQLLRVGGFHNVRPVSARGAYIFTEDGRAILDCVSSYGALNLGHNHPRLVEAKKAFLATEAVQLSKELLLPYGAALAHNLAALTPGRLERVFFCNSGTEAVEGALKLAERAAGAKRNLLLYTSNSLHGKTRGALSVTGRDTYRAGVRLLDSTQEIPYGDLDIAEQALRTYGEETAAFILEPIQGEAGVIEPPAGYLSEVKRLCRQYGVLLIFDEVQTGFGRTGTLFAFEHENVTPDILCLAKSLGGGMVPIGAYLTTPEIYDRAYGKSNECLVHTSTFGGMSESCTVALEAVNLIVEDNIPDRAARMGENLKARLEELKAKHPTRIAAVRGRGLMLAIEFKPARVGPIPPLGTAVNVALKHHYPGLVAARLLEQHDLLATIMLNNVNVMRIYPSLLIGQKEIDHIVRALDAVLSEGLHSLVATSLRRAIRGVGLRGLRRWLGSQ